MAKAIAVADEQNTGIQRFKSQPEKLMSFLRDVRSEMRKVIWPGRAEVQATTIIVLVTVFIFAAYFELVDFIANHTLDRLLVYLSKH
ncbi:preprotein translocase subunit SecE [Granulicella arctica]|uniref:Protein translocase subunit SecE n=1 Tax=Granulicella arctica TaxID=940613 RepID=A0A7Y9TG28_9BACT|nr:preprotein translocase subunit SecE [Granulicella arctica]NYF79436.1 preprotein translocase subunit SecE [Granulicella arctica]